MGVWCGGGGGGSLSERFWELDTARVNQGLPAALYEHNKFRVGRSMSCEGGKFQGGGWATCTLGRISQNHSL